MMEALYSDDDQNRRQPALSTFAGTDDPRELRLLGALLCGPLMRERADRVARASNGPHYVMTLRRKGLDIPCERIAAKDSDGKPCRPGRYALTDDDRCCVLAWMERAGLSRDELQQAGGDCQ